MCCEQALTPTMQGQMTGGGGRLTFYIRCRSSSVQPREASAAVAAALLQQIYSAQSRTGVHRAIKHPPDTTVLASRDMYDDMVTSDILCVQSTRQ